MSQPTLQTKDDLLENPQDAPVAKGLVARSSVLWAAVIFILILLSFAVYDLTRSETAAATTASTGADGEAKVQPSVGPAPLEADIGVLAERQENKVTPSVMPAQMQETSPRAPAGVDSSRGTNVVLGQVAPGAVTHSAPAGDQSRTERDAQAAESKIFSIGSQGGDSMGEQLDTARAVLTNAADPLQRQIENLRRTVATPAQAALDPGADLAKVAATLQGAQKQAPTQGKDQAWLTGEAQTSTADATYAKTPPSAFMIFQGTRVPIVTREAINSDLPGPVTAMSTANVYDSINQCAVLIPAGTKFIGQYSADIRPGQSRLLLAYRRMIFPDGRSVDLEGAQGVDGRGAAGAEGEVNNHFLQMFGYGFALALIGDQLGGKSNVTIRTNDGTSQTTTIAGQVVSETATRIMQRNSVVQPTITLEPGSRMFVTVARDISLTPTSRKNCR